MNNQHDIQDLAFAMRGHVLAGNVRRAEELADQIEALQGNRPGDIPAWAELWRVTPKGWMGTFPHAYLVPRTFYAPHGSDNDDAARYACHSFRRGDITADDVELVDTRAAMALIRGAA
jgi:hypothetical protein